MLYRSVTLQVDPKKRREAAKSHGTKVTAYQGLLSEAGKNTFECRAFPSGIDLLQVTLCPGAPGSSFRGYLSPLPESNAPEILSEILAAPRTLLI